MCVKGRGSCLPAAQRLIFQLQSVLWAFFFLTCNICPAFPMVDMDLALKLPHAVRWRIVKASLLKGSVELDITSHPNVLFSHANKFEEDSFYYLCGVSHRSSLRNHASYLPHEDLELSLLSYYYFCSILKKKGGNYKRVCDLTKDLANYPTCFCSVVANQRHICWFLQHSGQSETL